MTTIRKASLVLSTPPLLMVTWWVSAYCYPPFALSQAMTPYILALEYLCYACAALAIILLLRTHRAKGTMFCLVINLVATLLNIFGGRLLAERIVPYIRF